MKSNIILVGFMGTGKTTNGRRVAKQIGYEFVDTDLMIEAREKRTIPQIFDQSGEKYFRNLEHNTIRRVHRYKKAVISTGGGTVLNPKNLELLKKHGVVFLLENTSENLIYRLENAYIKRPLLMRENWQSVVCDMLDKRRPLYEGAADYRIYVGQKAHSDVVEEILYYWDLERRK
jgi:shikimate kinase